MLHELGAELWLSSHPLEELPSQLSKPELHDASWQVRVAHEADALEIEQLTPHPPQLLSVLSGFSHPLPLLPSQLAKPELQLEMRQVPLPHVVLEFARLQAEPQAPQLVLVFNGASQPLLWLPSQLPKPLLQVVRLQVPVLQVADPLLRLQVAPQAPQLARVVNGASQPLPASPSQSPKPLLQEATPQTPLLQDGVPLAAEQTVPQAPQLLTELRFVSQPLKLSPSQFAQPGLHETTSHEPDAQEEVAFGRVHVMPHAPQLLVVFSGVSQPLASMPSQFDQPTLQVPSVQMPELQDAPALAREQLTPQPPQLSSELSAVSQPLLFSPSQLANPDEHVPSVQTPVEQDSEALRRSHVTPQPPQLFTARVLVSQPLLSVPSQLAKPLLQDSVEQTPEAHVAVAFPREQGTPQPPQSVSVLMRVSHPLASMPSQLDQPGEQARIEQLPAAHVAVALAREHVVPHSPQLLSVLRGVSQPVESCESQSAKPSSQVVISQVSDSQVSVALASEQGAPHAPQLLSVVTGVSQPLASMPSQLDQPASHERIPHTPEPQEAVALARVHAVPQPPQSLRVRMFVSQPLVSRSSQSSNPAEQEETRQVPDEQSPLPDAGAQTEPQLPQSLSVLSGVSQPLASIPSQFDQPALQVSSSQLPVEQEVVALGRLQAVPHVPQLLRVRMLVSHPLPPSRSQSANPGLQVPSEQTPVSQLSLALARSHVMPQAAQLVSVLSDVSQPLASTPSQLDHPRSQPAVTQDPVVQLAEAFCRSHSTPQAPQSVSVRMSVSQPLAGLASQSEKPGRHEAMRQLPVVH